MLEAQVHGQLPLFTVPRVLGDATVSAIVGRPVTGWEQARQVIEAMEAEHGLTAGWRRKVAESNPHLLVSQKTAVDPDHPAVSTGLLSGALPRGLTLSGLRQDRILNEAAESADPLRLMRLFGITEQTAMRYVGAAHPERTSKLPR
ncbi:hypothetical protein [Streptomyces sp. V4I2]|uniref:hypothetical protein n=1 Tax=Streptomyces sp. V4I2 TaxID=3042280 RepID=UPI0027D89E70|nr:hypothetical protein [Streptomyces sp. V4I2]